MRKVKKYRIFSSATPARLRSHEEESRTEAEMQKDVVNRTQDLHSITGEKFRVDTKTRVALGGGLALLIVLTSRL